MSNEMTGLKKAKKIYENRAARARELKAQGKTIIGYPCMYAPLEFITALDLFPFRTSGDMAESVTEADRALPTSFCPLMRSCMDCALKGKNDFIDGMVAVHSCDPQEKTARIWQSYTSYPFFHFIDMPGTLRPESVEYYKGQLKDFKKALEAFTGKEISRDRLKTAIELHNRQRALVRALYESTKPSPPLISGTEMLPVIKALMSLPVVEGNELLDQVIQEVRTRTDGPQAKPARLLIWSSTLDNVGLMEILEARSNVVVDEGCGGIRPFREDVKLTEDPIDGLAHFYLTEITCARTFREAVPGSPQKEYAADLENRFAYLKEIAKEWNVNGVILLHVRHCDPFAYEVPSLKDYFDSLGIPSTYIEYDYTQGALAPMRTRIEAFLETLD
jgi:benzoyl-CoA reductase subunit C